MSREPLHASPRPADRRTSETPPLRLALSPDAAAAALGVSRDYFDEHIRPTLRIVRLGRRVIVPIAELERWLRVNAALAVGEDR